MSKQRKTAAEKQAEAAKRKQQLAKAMAHPLRVLILTELQSGINSPNGLAQKLGEPLGNVSYHVKTLLEHECVELVKTEPRRGAVEHFYRATGPVTITTAAQLSPIQRGLVAGVLAEAMSNGIGEGYTDKEKAEIEAARKTLEKAA